MQLICYKFCYKKNEINFFYLPFIFDCETKKKNFFDLIVIKNIAIDCIKYFLT